MRIIPAIDLMRGQVVRGIAGRRAEYRPLVSQLVDGSEPADVANALVNQCQLRLGYVADLDAIAGAAPAWSCYDAIHQAGMRLWIDAGSSNVGQAIMLAEHLACEAVIVGLESLSDWNSLQEIVTKLGSNRVIFSLDLRVGVPITNMNDWREASPCAIAIQAVQRGITRMIVLDIAAVGTQSGPVNLQLARDILVACPTLKLIGGGGVRCNDDLQSLEKAGYSAAMVASALHDGRLTLQHNAL